MHTLTRVLGAALLLPVIGPIILAVITPLTLSGILYLIGVSGLAVSLCGVAWGFKRSRWVFGIALMLILAVAAVRVLAPHSNKVTQLRLPQGDNFCGISCLIDEQDASLVSTRVLPFIGWISPTEQAGLLDAMYAAYSQLSAVQSISPSPFIRTYLSLQRPNDFDAVIIEPDDSQTPQMGLIFLHGFTGNFTMPCWLMAQTVTAFQALTVCPSVGWKGDWWTSNGETTLRATITYMQRRGINRIFLAGLSNGAVGASDLAYKLTDDLAGLILISGAALDAQASGLPVLVLAGSRDERMPADMLQSYATQIGDQATFVQLDADHFMLVKQFDAVRQHIDSWLRQVISP